MTTNDIIGFGTVPAYTNTIANDAYDYLVDHDATNGITRRAFARALREVLESVDEVLTVGDLTALLEESLPEVDDIYLERIAIEIMRG